LDLVQYLAGWIFRLEKDLAGIVVLDIATYLKQEKNILSN